MAVWFRRDDIYLEFSEAECYGRLHRVAIRYDVYLNVKRSNITRGWTYNAEILFIRGTGRFHEDGLEIKQYTPHGVGQGVNPILACIDAVRLCNLKTPDILVAILECELWLLARAVRIARACERAEDDLDATLDDLTEALALVNVEPYQNTAALAAENDEDDDL